MSHDLFSDGASLAPLSSWLRMPAMQCATVEPVQVCGWDSCIGCLCKLELDSDVVDIVVGYLSAVVFCAKLHLGKGEFVTALRLVAA